jgi:ferrochelatase
MHRDRELDAADTPEFGVLLVNLGSPAAPTPAAVRSYLREFLADRRVVDLPRLKWWLIRNLFILPLRPRRSARLYRTIWTDEGSPLVVTTVKIGRALEVNLGKVSGTSVPVVVAMRYGSPTITEGLESLISRSCPRVLVLPLYPQFSTTTTASVLDAVDLALPTLRSPPEIRVVTDYHDHRSYIEALATSVQDHWDRHGPAERLMISFHGLPQRTVDAGDPYPRQCAATARSLAARLGLGPGRWHMAYQSRFGREPWLRPNLDERLEEWGRRGQHDVDVVCPGFAADCLETLEEVATTTRALFLSAGGRGFRYIPALNDRPEHITTLADVIADHTQGWAAERR